MSYRQRFDDFVAHQISNEMAKKIFVMLTEDIAAQVPSPLLLIGPSGTGKTHLTTALRDGLTENFPEKKIVFFQAEDFANRVVTIFKTGSHADMLQFKNDCRSTTSVFIVEDIQFLFDKPQLLQELIKTVDYLSMKESCKVILTSSVDPHLSPQLHPRIISRLAQGLTLHLHNADFSERMQILKLHCRKKELQLPPFIEEHICQNVLSVRRIIGAVNRLAVLCRGSLLLSANECSILLRDMVRQENDLNCETIKNVVADFYGCTPRELISQNRDIDFIMARQIAEYLAYHLLDCSITEIANHFNRDRTTVTYSIEKIKKESSRNPALQSRIDQLTRLLVPEQGQ